MKSKLWMSAAASIALVAAAAGCNANTTTNSAGDVARSAGNAAGNAAGMAGDAVSRGANAVGNVAGQGIDAVGQGVGAIGNGARRGANAVGNGIRQGADAAGNATGLNGARGTATSAVNPAGTNANGVVGNVPGRSVGGWANPNDISSYPSVNVNNATRTVTLGFRDLTPSATGWHVGRVGQGTWHNQLTVTIPTGWTLRVNNGSPGYGHVAVGIIPYAAAATPANGTFSKTMSSTLPGRYHIVAQTSGRTRDVLGIVNVMPATSGVNVSFGQQM